MNKRPAIIIVLVLSSVVIILGVVELQTKIIRRLVDNVLYDNRFHYIPCEKLPSIAEVEKVISEHHDVIEQVEAVNPDLAGFEVQVCNEVNADITFWYGSHEDRVTIEQIIGNDTFFGVPYILQNR
jgi:hypothetical protein